MNTSAVKPFQLKIGGTEKCPVNLLNFDFNNPRLQTGLDIDVESEEALVTTLADIAALDEIVTSICTNEYLNLEPLIVIGEEDQGPFRVLEGNRRLASIKLILNPELAQKLGIKLPKAISHSVLSSIQKILCHRVKTEEDARAFIGFKHINGPQRWDAYAKARYVTDWYKQYSGKTTIGSIAAKMGDTNDTLRAYIYSVLILEQAADAKLWTIRDRTNGGRFAFSHLYTALGRKEYQEYLGLQGPWSDAPSLTPVATEKLKNLQEVLTYIYGSKPDDRLALVRSQNPDLKDVGLAIADPNARAVLQAKGTLDDARDALKSPNTAFQDAVIAANLKLKRAVDLLNKYDGTDTSVNAVVEEVYERADTLLTMNKKKKGYSKHGTV